MNFRLVDSGWDRILDDALKSDHSRIRIVCPFIKERAARRLLEYGHPKQFQVITRFDLDGFLAGISDIKALRLFLEAGAQIRGVKNLHAKAYLIGSDRAIVTSANLTEQGLLRNHEFGFLAQDASIAASCHEYFENLWKRAGADLNARKLDEWEKKVTASLASGGGSRINGALGDEGKDLGFSLVPVEPLNWVTSAEQGFVKFFGEGHKREKPSLPILSEVDRSGCYFACNYPEGKKPRQVQDGAIMFMGRLVDHPKDILIFGRAIGLKYKEGRDDATEAEIKKRPWKADWSRYIRVHDAEFVNGTLSDGVSLSALMEELGPNSFASTKRHLLAGVGNTNPRSAYNQQAAVELTPEAITWLIGRLDYCFARHGRISRAELDKLDWPEGSKVR